MALITNTDTSIFPYNDSDMVYDLDRQLYVLTIEGVRSLTGYDLLTLVGTTAKADFVRYEVSQDIYNFIAMYSLQKSFKIKQWLIAKDGTLRSTFKRMLADQFRYYINSGAGTLKDMHGVNLSNGKVVDLSHLRGNTLISGSVEAQLKISGLLYSGYMYNTDYSIDGTW